MKYFNSIILLFTIAICSSCSKNEQDNLVETINANPFDSISISMELPSGINIYDNKLFITDLFSSDSLIIVYDLLKNQIVSSFGKKGEGPEEFLHISNIDFFTNKDGNCNISLFDPVKQRMVTYNIAEHNYNFANISKSEVAFKNIGNRLHECYNTAFGFLGTGFIEGKKYLTCSDSLTDIEYQGLYRPKPNKSIPESTHIIANYGKTIVSKNKDMFIEIIYNTPVISLYRIENDKIRKSWEYLIKEQDYEVIDGSIKNKTPMGYLSASFGDNQIYALYSGEYDSQDEIASYGKEIHIFNYNGELKKKVIIDIPAFQLDVDEKSETLYILSHLPEPIIRKYNL